MVKAKIFILREEDRLKVFRNKMLRKINQCDEKIVTRWSKTEKDT
jgi:hypothetical protein